MKRSRQDADSALAALVQATRQTRPAAEVKERLEEKLAPWLDPRRTPELFASRALKVVAVALGVGLLAHFYQDRSVTYETRTPRAWSVAARLAFVHDTPATAPDRATPHEDEAPTTTKREAFDPAVATTPARKLAEPARLPEGPAEEDRRQGRVTTAAETPREPEVDYLRRTQAVLASAPREALALAEEHPALYPRGVLVQEREVIAIDALVRLGRHDEAASRAAAFRARFPRSAHLSRIATLTETK